MSMTQFSMTLDINGYNGFGVNFSNTQYQALISANVESTLTVPATGDAIYRHLIAIFSFDPGDSVWVGINNTATIPSSGTFAQCHCELNPAARYVNPGDVIHFITSDTSDQVGVSFYAVT